MSKLLNLLRTFFLVEFRDKNNSGLGKFFGSAAIYLFANTMLSFGFQRTFNEKSFVILSFSSILFLLSFIVLTDMDNLFFPGRHKELLRSLPIDTGTLFLSKAISAMMFLSVLIISALIPQLIFFYGYSESISRCIIFAGAEFMFAYFIIGLEIILYSFAVKFLKSKATLLINLMQMLFFIFIFYSTSLSAGKSGMKSISIREDISVNGIVKYLPQTFYASAVDNAFIASACVLITFFLFVFLFFFLKRNFDSISDNFASIRSAPVVKQRRNQLKSFWTAYERIFLKDNIESAAFSLARSHIRNSKYLRLKFFPVFLMPVIVALTGVVLNVKTLISFDELPFGNFAYGAVILISPTVTFTFVMCSRLLLSNTKILDTSSTATLWIYESLPITDFRKLLAGTSKYVYVYFIVPALLIVLIILSFKLPFTSVLLNLLFVASGIFFINSINMTFDKTYPFTLESSKFSSISKITEILFSIVLGIILFFIQIFVFQNIIFVIVSIVILISAAMLLNRK